MFAQQMQGAPRPPPRFLEDILIEDDFYLPQKTTCLLNYQGGELGGGGEVIQGAAIAPSSTGANIGQ